MAAFHLGNGGERRKRRGAGGERAVVERIDGELLDSCGTQTFANAPLFGGSDYYLKSTTSSFCSNHFVCMNRNQAQNEVELELSIKT
jgi:hypothetical protein